MGNDNTAIGFSAASQSTPLAVITSRWVPTPALNIITGNGNIHIGHIGFANDSGTIRIGGTGKSGDDLYCWRQRGNCSRRRNSQS